MNKTSNTINPINANIDDLAKALISGNKNGLPYAKVSGVLPIGGLEIDCAVLNDETRVLSSASVFRSFGRPPSGSNNRLVIHKKNMPPFIAAKNLSAYITSDIHNYLTPISYTDGNQTKQGFNSKLLPLMCEIYLKARRDNNLAYSQRKLAEQSEILLLSFSQVGIASLIDEATGYQNNRTYDALRRLLDTYIEENMRKWVKTFPDSFFQELDRLYKNNKTTSRSRPRYYGNFINTYVYEPIENGAVKKKLNQQNIDEKGNRKARFHQWLSSDGIEVLNRQLSRIEGIMEISDDLPTFKENAKKQKPISVLPPDFFNAADLENEKTISTKQSNLFDVGS